MARLYEDSNYWSIIQQKERGSHSSIAGGDTSNHVYVGCDREDAAVIAGQTADIEN